MAVLKHFMKSILLKQTRTLADEIQTQAIKALSLEPEVMKRFSNELVQLRKDLKFRYSPPLEKLMIEQVLAAHAQSMVALYKLETFPINVEVKNDRRYLEERANGTHMRLCRSIAVLAGLRRMGMRQGQYEAGGLGERQHFPPGMRPAQQFSESEWKGEFGGLLG